MTANIEYLQNLTRQQSEMIKKLERENEELKKEVQQLKEKKDDCNNLTQV